MQEGKEWLREPENTGAAIEEGIEIPAADIYEVAASKVDFALMDLRETSFTKLEPSRATWYTGAYYTCPEGKRPYLSRAVYGHAGTGDFSIKRVGEDLLILHRSLGRSTIYQKTALILNLEFEPDQIYIRVRIAE